MLEDFIKWMASLSKDEQAQKMNILIDLFVPRDSYNDFKRIKAALYRRDERIRLLETEVQAKKKPTIEELFHGICNSPCYHNLRQHIVAAFLYRNLSSLNKELRNKNKQLQTDIEQLIYKLNNKDN